MRNSFNVWAMLACIAMLFTACRPTEGVDPTTDFAPSTANGKLQNAITTVQDIIYEAVSTSEALNTLPGSVVIGTCPVVTYTPTGNPGTFPGTLIIDFGSGCTWREQEISGSISLEVSGKVSDGNATLTGQVNDLEVDGVKVSVDLVVTLGAAPESLRDMTIVMTDGSIVTADGKTVTISSMTITRTQVAGTETKITTSGDQTALEDDEFDISFAAEGTGSDGKTYTLTTTTVLHRELACRWVVSGVAELTSGFKTATLDFGDGTCDNKITIAIAGEEITVNLP